MTSSLTKGGPARLSNTLHGPCPDLIHLDDGDPKYAIDFRRLYATLLQRWLEVPPRDVLDTAFETMPVLHG
jgi:hypothetical protein